MKSFFAMLFLMVICSVSKADGRIFVKAGILETSPAICAEVYRAVSQIDVEIIDDIRNKNIPDPVAFGDIYARISLNYLKGLSMQERNTNMNYITLVSTMYLRKNFGKIYGDLADLVNKQGYSAETVTQASEKMYRRCNATVSFQSEVLYE